jgi:hypothetical protein
MKSRVLIGLFVVLMLCAVVPIGYGISQVLAHYRAQSFAREIADTLGRTPGNSIVDFESCGMFTCGYNVYFASPEDHASMDARVRAPSKLDLRVGLASPGGSGNSLLDINSDLDRTQIRGRLTVTSTSTYREPTFSYWTLQNERGETVCRIWLYWTRDTGVTYLFDGKPIPNSNIVHLYTEVSPIKE